MLMAVSLLYRRQIYVYSDESKKPICLTDDFVRSKPIRLGSTGNSHYVALRPITQHVTVVIAEDCSPELTVELSDDSGFSVPPVTKVVGDANSAGSKARSLRADSTVSNKSSGATDNVSLKKNVNSEFNYFIRKF